MPRPNAPRKIAKKSPRSLATRSLARAVVVAVLLGCNDATGPSGPTNPADAVFVTSDVANFWAAYDAGSKTGSASAFQSKYLDQASAGLREFIKSRSVTATSLVQMVQAYPQYFAAIRANALSFVQQPIVIGRIRANYERIESLYPAAVYPPVTFLVGRFSTMGTTQSTGILIGTEFFGMDDTTPLQELNSFARANVHPFDSLPAIIAHEHTHVLQSQARQLMSKPLKTLLDQSLLEGSADFVAELVSGSHPNTLIYEWALPREHDLWLEFQQVMNGRDVSQWLYNQGSATPDRPGDLGYFIGYRIVQAYYTKTPDKTAALRDIIEMKDGADFLAASGYNP
jgi:hypothetical protein